MTALLILESGNLGQQIRVPKAAMDYAWKERGVKAQAAPGKTPSPRSSCWRRCCCRPGGGRGVYPRETAYGPGLDAFVARMNATAVTTGHDAHPLHLAGRAYPTQARPRPTPPRPTCFTLGLAAMKVPRLSGRSWDLRFLPPAEGPRPPPVLVGQHRRADRLLSGRPSGSRPAYTDKALPLPACSRRARNGRTLIRLPSWAAPPTGGKRPGAQDAEKIAELGASGSAPRTPGLARTALLAGGVAQHRRDDRRPTTPAGGT